MKHTDPESLMLIERAKKQLQIDNGWSEPAAHRWMQRTSMDRRLAMRQVAEEILKGNGAHRELLLSVSPDR